MTSFTIGAGITGSVYSFINNTALIDKAKFEGGRCSSGRIDNLIFDKGATFLKKEIEFIYKKRTKKFNLVNFFNLIKKDIKFENHKFLSNLFTPTKGMQSLVSIFINRDNIHLNSEVLKFKYMNNKIKIYTKNSEYESDNLLLTPPLPQSLNLIDEPAIKKEWEIFTEKFSNYRKTLVLTGKWNGNFKINNQNISELKSGDSLEYYTIESHKVSENQSLVLSIQFSEKFSDTYFDSWMDQNKNPSSTTIEIGHNYFKKIFQKLNLEYMSPDSIRVHRWKYAIPSNSVFQKDELLNFDSDFWDSYSSLCKEHKTILAGDWIFGQRVTKNILGSIYLSTIFGNPPVWVEEILT